MVVDEIGTADPTATQDSTPQLTQDQVDIPENISGNQAPASQASKKPGNATKSNNTQKIAFPGHPIITDRVLRSRTVPGTVGSPNPTATGKKKQSNSSNMNLDC
ncbi:hypothetical protein AX774_g6624 [Zancudomyces culisetae]|uniref:Uncharacterized protein n=1 Tax=Zancudomyces culisetae TaxID=1213189 RepID=A0A1R1PG93_ZANCU|nr:hypothetical protein AX774_g6624 [Zancudomyces culisetae]|eukprot:OMH79949.1 hypothetical protein AX774_g6624 [Zancudomyces culisetae]